MHIFIKKINLTVYHANFTSGTNKFKIEDVGLFKDGNFLEQYQLTVTRCSVEYCTQHAMARSATSHWLIL